MIAEKIQRAIDSLRTLIQRGNGDLEHMASTILDSLESEAERVAGLEGAAYLNFDDVPYTKPQGAREVANG